MYLFGQSDTIKARAVKILTDPANSPNPVLSLELIGILNARQYHTLPSRSRFIIKYRSMDCFNENEIMIYFYMSVLTLYN